MKQLVGYLIILGTIPLLFIVQKAIATEIQHIDHFNLQMNDSIELISPALNVPVRLKDRDGHVFSEEYADLRDPLPLSSIPLVMQQLFLESEDRGFYEHKGYDVAAIVRAFAVNSSSDDVKQGGSTITQQVVRMRFLSPEKTYERKLTELFYAAELEKQSSKDEILGMYLNEMYFGNRVYGVGAASLFYFNKPLDELTVAEMAFIAAIPNNPSLYDPLKHFDRTKKRQERLLGILQANGKLTVEEVNAQSASSIRLNVKKKENNFPVYSTYVLAELKELIADSEGFTKSLHNAGSKDEKALIAKQLDAKFTEVMASGLIIETALDPKKQLHDENRINAMLHADGLQAGAAVIDNRTREIVSLYGGKNYRKADFNRSYQAIRQPGSAIKPLLVYAPLFESTSYTVNTPVNSGRICIGTFCPTNIGGYVYGNVSVREAFRQSHNTAAVRLFQMVGVEEGFNFLVPFGFDSITKKDHNYAAALGGFSSGVTPLELARAYTGFIDGNYEPAHAIRTVTDREGNLKYSWPDKRMTVWTPGTVSKVRYLLEETVVNGTGRGIAYTTSYTGAKTGTTDHYKDIWAAGLNDEYTAAVWLGYDRPTSVQWASERKLHLKIFSTLLQD